MSAIRDEHRWRLEYWHTRLQTVLDGIETTRPGSKMEQAWCRSLVDVMEDGRSIATHVCAEVIGGLKL